MFTGLVVALIRPHYPPTVDRLLMGPVAVFAGSPQQMGTISPHTIRGQIERSEDRLVAWTAIRPRLPYRPAMLFGGFLHWKERVELLHTHFHRVLLLPSLGTQHTSNHLYRASTPDALNERRRKATDTVDHTRRIQNSHSSGPL